MSLENFALEVTRAPVKSINRAEWTGKGSIPEITACLAPTGFLSLTSPANFKGYIEIKGNLEHYEKDGSKWIYHWSQAAKDRALGQGTLTLKYDDDTINDIVVAVKMSRLSDLIIKRQPFLTLNQIFAAIGIGFFAGLLLLLFFVH